MSTSSYFFFSTIIFLFFGHSASNVCDTTTSCVNSTVPIRFPFQLNEPNRTNRCSYPGFDLTCDKKNQPFLTLPESGDYIAKIIYYQQQTVWINVDPTECFPRRIMLNRGFSLAGSPFRLGTGFALANYSFYNCPYDETSSYLMLEAVDCLSNKVNNVSYTVVAVLSDPPQPTPWITNSSSCRFIDSALVPVPGTRHHELYWNSYYLDIQLEWDEPDCRDCEQRGGRCGGLLADFSYQVVCYDLPGQGLSRKTRYGLAIGLGIPGLIGVIGLACLYHRRTRMHEQQEQQQRRRTEFSTLSIIPHPAVVSMGLDGSSIERYPKTQLGDSGRLPRPNDTVCSICLSEYRPKETLRTIPDCNHYFHVDCIDGWLKMNATCPLCRNLPGRSSSTSSSSLPFSPTSS